MLLLRHCQGIKVGRILPDFRRVQYYLAGRSDSGFFCFGNFPDSTGFSPCIEFLYLSQFPCDTIAGLGSCDDAGFLRKTG